MPSPCDPADAPVGDVGAALMIVDSRIKALHSSQRGSDPEQQQLIEQYAASLGPAEVTALLDGMCTLIYMYLQWLRQACEDHDEDVIEYSVAALVSTMRMMPKTFPPEVIPTMAGLLVAAATELSPNLWRAQYGAWTDAEINPLEATAVLAAEQINRMTGDHEFATRLITEALTTSENL